MCIFCSDFLRFDVMKESSSFLSKIFTNFWWTFWTKWFSSHANLLEKVWTSFKHVRNFKFPLCLILKDQSLSYFNGMMKPCSNIFLCLKKLFLPNPKKNKGPSPRRRLLPRPVWNGKMTLARRKLRKTSIKSRNIAPLFVWSATPNSNCCEDVKRRYKLQF